MLEDQKEKTSADIYVFEINESDNSAAANVLRMVGTGKKVLEIGAGPGSIARPMVLRNGCSVTALEIDPNCIPILNTFCERVVPGDLNGTAWVDQFETGSFDVVVIADVLEHLTNPWRTLRLVSTLIKDNGYVVCSIPNASHAVILACFATDDVEYREWGLLDRTHIRFFGVHNVQALFRQAGLTVSSAEYVIRPPEMTEFADRWKHLSAAQQAQFDSGPFSQLYQTVVKARLAAVNGEPEFVLANNPPLRRAAPLYHRSIPSPFRRAIGGIARRLLSPSARSAIKKRLGL